MPYYAGLAYLSIICEFHVLFIVKKRLGIWVVLNLLAIGYGFGQGNGKVIPLNFPDSVMIVLENTRNVDATVVGTGFAAAWNSLGMDQQQTIRRQTLLMRKKKFPLRPHFVNYFGAIVNAVNVEHADAQVITKFLSVTGKVLEKYPTPKVLNFLATCRTFFSHHSLHYEKTFRLYARDDSYTFDYIEPAPVISWDQLNNTTPTELPPTDQPINESDNSTQEQPTESTESDTSGDTADD